MSHADQERALPERGLDSVRAEGDVPHAQASARCGGEGGAQVRLVAEAVPVSHLRGVPLGDGTMNREAAFHRQPAALALVRRAGVRAVVVSPGARRDGCGVAFPLHRRGALAGRDPCALVEGRAPRSLPGVPRVVRARQGALPGLSRRLPSGVVCGPAVEPDSLHGLLEPAEAHRRAIARARSSRFPHSKT